MGVDAGEISLLTEAKDYLKARYNKPGNVYLGVVSRIDSLVTGAVVFARTSKAAARLSEQFREGTPQKTYWAIVQPPLKPANGRCEDWLLKDEPNHCMRIARQSEPGALAAQLNYQTIAQRPPHSVLEIELLTGRKHQIRLQLAQRGSPILGDGKYGSRQLFPTGIALHSRQLILEHPISHDRISFTAPLPASWQAWQSLLPQ